MAKVLKIKEMTAEQLRARLYDLLVEYHEGRDCGASKDRLRSLATQVRFINDKLEPIQGYRGLSAEQDYQLMLEQCSEANAA